MMSFKDFKKSKEKQIAASNDEVAGPQQTQKKSNLDQMAASSSVTSFATKQTSKMKACRLYPFIGDTYRYIRRNNSGLNKDIYNTHLLENINKYKIGCNKIYEDAFKSREMCLKLAQNIVRTIDLFKEMCTTYTNMEEYQHRICELMAIYIACELRLGVDSTTEEQCLIGNRIIYIMRKHLIQEEKDDSRYNILRTLVYIPRLFNARDIVCAIFEEFIPLTPVTEVNIFPDKLYMLYIIVFYRWMSMQKTTDAKNEIVKFAETFMKPSATLASNKLYALHLPLYKTYSTATRSILNNISYYKDIKNAAIIDNALKKMGSIVNLCDDEDDDVILEDTTKNNDFVEQFSSIQLEPLGCSFTNIKLEETTVVSTVDLTTDEEMDCESSILEKHNKWLNGFQQIAKQFRDSQILIEKQQTTETQKVICLDSDSECEEEDAIVQKVTNIEENSKGAGDSEDLFVDNYALTTTPINCESDLETSDAEDMTKLSSRFLPGTLRTYQAKKDKETTTTEKEIRSQTPESNLPTESDNMAYRRDSIHISSTPPQRSINDEDDGTDVQDENDDVEPYTFLTTTHKKSEKELIVKEPKPVSLYPYPSINLNLEKIIFSQTNPRLQQEQQRQQQYYFSDSSEVKTPKKSEQQKKHVHFNTSPLGPTSAYSSSQKHMPKPSLLQHKYKASDAPDYFHIKGSERFSSAASISGSTSTTASTSSSLKQQQEQEHLAFAATLFRGIIDRPRVNSKIYPAPFSPSSSSASSRSLTSPATAVQSPKKPRYLKNLKSTKLRRATMCGKEDFDKQQDTQSNVESSSIIKKRVGFEYTCSGPPNIQSKYFNDGDPSLRDSSDDYYDTASDSDRYKKDVKLRKRCAVVITPTKEILQYERNRDLMYNKLLQEQRRKLELRAIEKQREKERRLLERGERREQLKECSSRAEDRETAIKRDTKLSTYPNYNEACMSSESELETQNQFPIRKQLQHVKELQPLNVQVEMTEVTSSLLNKIDAHLDKPEACKRLNEEEDKNEEKMTESFRQSDIKENYNQTTKMRELNLLADIAQHLSPYQLELPNEQTNPISTLPTTALEKEMPTITEQIIIPSFDNLIGNQLGDNNQQHIRLPTTTEQESQDEQEHESHVDQEHYDCQQKSTAESLEHILEESIVTAISAECTFNYRKDNTPKTESTIPLLISSVESLNHLEVNMNNNKSSREESIETEEIVKEKLNDSILITENIFLHKTNVAKEIDNDVEMQGNKDTAKVVDNLPRKTESILTSTLLESSLNTTYLSEISCAPETSRNFKQSLMPADISDISLESEISKHLPDIAEPSPIVTDMSENSMESDVSKSCKKPTDDCAMASPAPIAAEAEPESSFNISLNLHTPTKITITDLITQQPTDILNTPIKTVMEPDLETPVKSSQEPETDSNVTKFLDLILNKTVTADESETRDKILKELNAISDEPTAAPPLENTENCATQILAKAENCKLASPLESFEFSSTQTFAKAQACNLLNDSEVDPPKSPCKEFNTQTLVSANNVTTNFTPCSTPPLSVPSNLKTHSKQIFNTKCRVRLKRLNISEQSRTNKEETWVAIPLAKLDDTPTVVNGNNEILNCDINTNETTTETSLIKKPCLKQTLSNTLIIEDLLEKNKIHDNVNNMDIQDNSSTKKNKFDTTAEQTIIDSNLLFSAISTKPKSKPLKTVTFDISNLELRDTSSSSSHKQKLKNYMKSQKLSRKPPESTLRRAETLQLLVNTINDNTRTPPAAEFNKKRSSIKNKCIAEDETHRPASLASALMGGGSIPACKKSCIDKSRSTQHINSSATKCKDLVSSLATVSLPTITSDITTARIYTSSPLDKTLPEYDDNVDTVADSELILPSTTSIGSLRRKLKKPRKTITRPEPADDISTDDISNQPPECNVDDDTDAVVDNEDDVFVEELLPIPAANEHILEEIVSARTPHIGTGTVIRDDYMNIEATDTVPVYLFNDESRDLATPEPKQISETNVVDSSSFLNTSSSACNLANHTNSTATTTTGNLEKSMLSPSEHEVSSTQETFFQTPTKSKQNVDSCADNKDKTTPLIAIPNQKQEENHVKSKKDKMSSCLLQNNQVDTTNHSPEMCTLTLTTSSTSSNRKIYRKASTHDEILFNELQQQKLHQQKRKIAMTTTSCAESTSGDNLKKSKMEEIKTNGSLEETEKVTKKDDKRERIQPIGAGVVGGCGGSSPSTTTSINEEKLSKSKRKKMKSSKSEKSKNMEKSDPKTTPLTTESHIAPANPLIITIPKSRLLRPPPTPSPTPKPLNDQSERPSSPVNNKAKEKQHHHNHQSLKNDNTLASIVKKSKRTYSSANMVQKVFVPDDMEQCIDSEVVPSNASNTTQENAKFSSSSLSLTISKKKKSSSKNKTTTKSNAVFIKDKYDLIKSKEKHDISEKKDKQSDSINKIKEKTDLVKTKEKHDSHSKSLTQRTHKSSSSKEKIKEKQKLKTKVTEKDDTSTNLPLNGSNEIIPNTANNSNSVLSSLSFTSLEINNKPSTRKSKSKKNAITTNSSDTNSSSSNSIKSKSSLSSTQTSLTLAPSLVTPSSVMAVSSNHVRKKLKTK